MNTAYITDYDPTGKSQTHAGLTCKIHRIK